MHRDGLVSILRSYMCVRCEGPCYLGGVGRGPVRFGRGGEQRTSATWGGGGRGEKAVPQQEIHLQGSAVDLQPAGVFICMHFVSAL